MAKIEYITTLYFVRNGLTGLVTASFQGHVDIVRILIEAKAQIHTQQEVATLYIYHQNTHYMHNYHNTKIPIAVLLDRGADWFCLYSVAGLLFIWQLKKAKLMW